MPGQKRLAGALAAVAVAVAISACGSSGGDNATIPPANATQLNAALNGVQDAVDAQDCKLAEQRAQDFINAVNALPDTVGTQDKDALRSAGENLEKLAKDPQQCVPNTGTTGLGGQQTTSTTQPTTTSVPTTTVPTTTTTPTPTTETSPPPSNGGGNEGNGGGGSTGTGGGGETSGGGGSTGGGGGAAGGGTGGTGGTGTGGTGGGGTG